MTPFVTPGRRASRGIVELTVQASMPARTSSATSAEAATVRGVVRGASRWYSDHTSSAKNGKPRKPTRDRKSTRLNSSHLVISYAVFCLKKKKTHDAAKFCVID